MRVQSITLIFTIVLAAIVSRAADEAPVWRPVDPADLQMKAPKVEAGADAEAIFWDVRIDDKKLTSIYYEHYIRLKIFTTRGQEKFSKFDIPYTKGQKIEDIAARVIRPDGSIVNLDPKDIFEREIIKAGNIKVKAKSFAVPSMEPGVIIEYRYKQIFKDAWGNGVKLIFQQDIPVQKITYRIRPQGGYKLHPHFFNMPETSFVADPEEKGFVVATMTNVPAYRVEPNMPPEDEVRRWAFVGYAVRDLAVWRSFYRRHAHWLSEYASATDSIKQKTAELLAGASTDDEKLRRIYNYVQNDIKNISFDRKLSEDERDRLDRKWDHAEDVIKTRLGNSVYIELLFSAMARAAGYQVGLIFVGNRGEAFFSPEKYPFSWYVALGGAAVKVGNEWRYFSPHVPYVPFGYVPWYMEGVISMLASDAGFEWQQIPVSRPDKASVRRTANLALRDDGVLEGNVKFEYSGQQAISRRRDMYHESDAKRREDVEAEIKARFSTAEITGLAVENVDDVSKPLTYTFKFRMPNYGQRTGQRLFFQPGFFEFGGKPIFSAADRKTSIHFRYPWSEVDEIEIKLPAGFDLESPEQPAPIADAKNIASLKVSMSINKTGDLMRYKREFHFGGSGHILFPAGSYTPLKDLFDNFHRTDSHLVTLRARK